MSIVAWLRNHLSGLSETDQKIARRVEASETRLAAGRPEEALETLGTGQPEDPELLARFLHMKIRVALALRDLLCLEGLALHAETLGQLLPEQARYLMLEAEAIGALNLAKSIAQGISASGIGAGADLLRIQQKKINRVISDGWMTIAQTALGAEYEDIRLIGWGRNSYIVSALPKDRQYKVAVKFLGPKAYGDARSRKRFEREVDALAQLDHPNILKVFAFHPEDPPYMVGEFFPGADLRRLLEQGRTFFASETAKIGMHLASAVAYAHERGLIHRNIQPSNVLINYQNDVKLIDFGLARLQIDSDVTSTGMVLGDWMYMPPEQFAGHTDPTPEMDVFGIGATLYHLVAKRPPYSRGKGLARQKAPPIAEVAPSLPGALKEVLERCLIEDPMERWNDPNEIAAKLKPLVA